MKNQKNTKNNLKSLETQENLKIIRIHYKSLKTQENIYEACKTVPIWTRVTCIFSLLYL